MASAPLLQYSEPKKPYQLNTDASYLAIGVVLKILTPQGYKLVAKKLKLLSVSEKNYLVHDKKLFAIVYTFTKSIIVLKKFKIYYFNKLKIFKNY